MDEKETKKHITTEVTKYETHLTAIQAAFEKQCTSIHATYKPKVEKALLAEDNEYAAQLVKEQNDKLQKIVGDLKKTVDENGKKFLKYLEGFVNKIERESKLAELKKELENL